VALYIFYLRSWKGADLSELSGAVPLNLYGVRKQNPVDLPNVPKEHELLMLYKSRSGFSDGLVPHRTLQIPTNVTSQHAMKCSEQIRWHPCTCACLSVRLDIEPRACMILLCFITRRIVILRLSELLLVNKFVSAFWHRTGCKNPSRRTEITAKVLKGAARTDLG
jgi:hypothetical protein